jgi:hypothetical protein
MLQLSRYTPQQQHVLKANAGQRVGMSPEEIALYEAMKKLPIRQEIEQLRRESINLQGIDRSFSDLTIEGLNKFLNKISQIKGTLAGLNEHETTTLENLEEKISAKLNYLKE